ncbi:hypothetical protein GGX14DRAFT_408674 [Mycena pura]|uniref:Uncharacterized protein n=1 Tax=Mycena pura TaxID=153505 RepID=A0AAD6USP4_9AGAR|nr:hypothetical protein GGX14DRAFT_408674 [Mycena pura]
MVAQKLIFLDKKMVIYHSELSEGALMHFEGVQCVGRELSFYRGGRFVSSAIGKQRGPGTKDKEGNIFICVLSQAPSAHGVWDSGLTADIKAGLGAKTFDGQFDVRIGTLDHETPTVTRLAARPFRRRPPPPAAPLLTARPACSAAARRPPPSHLFRPAHSLSCCPPPVMVQGGGATAGGSGYGGRGQRRQAGGELGADGGEKCIFAGKLREGGGSAEVSKNEPAVPVWRRRVTTGVDTEPGRRRGEALGVAKASPRACRDSAVQGGIGARGDMQAAAAAAIENESAHATT